MADLSDFDTVAAAEEGAVMEVRNPKTGEVMRHDGDEDNQGRPFTVTVRGRDSAAFRSLARSQADRRIQASMRTRTGVQTAVIEKDDLELTIAVTKSWDILIGGVQPPSTPDAFRSAYTKYPWLKEQVDDFIGTRSNFIKG